MTNTDDVDVITTRPRRVFALLWRATGVGILTWALVAGWPQAREAAAVLGGADRRLLATALICQLLALLLLSLCYRAALSSAGADVTLRPAAGIALRAAAVSRLLPGGGGAAAVFAVGRLRRSGVPDGPAAAGVAVNAVVTMGLLVVLVAAVGSGSVAVGSAAVAAVAAAVPAGAVLLRRVTVRQWLRRLSDSLHARRSLRVWAAALDTVAFGAVRPRQLVVAIAAAGSAWFCELAALWFAVAAVGHPLPLAALALGLGAANAAAAVPHTPGGVGVVDVAMTAAFVAAGLDAGVALGGVLGYRAVGFWLPVLAGSSLLGADAIGAAVGGRRAAPAVTG